MKYNPPGNLSLIEKRFPDITQTAHAQWYASYPLAAAGQQWVGCEELVRRECGSDLIARGIQCRGNFAVLNRELLRYVALKSL